MICKNAKRKDGYYVLTRVYVPSGEYHLEPQYIKDVTSKFECYCPKCNDTEPFLAMHYAQLKAKTAELFKVAVETSQASRTSGMSHD